MSGSKDVNAGDVGDVAKLLMHRVVIAKRRSQALIEEAGGWVAPLHDPVNSFEAS